MDDLNSQRADVNSIKQIHYLTSWCSDTLRWFYCSIFLIIRHNDTLSLASLKIKDLIIEENE